MKENASLPRKEINLPISLLLVTMSMASDPRSGSPASSPLFSPPASPAGMSPAGGPGSPGGIGSPPNRISPSGLSPSMHDQNLQAAAATAVGSTVKKAMIYVCGECRGDNEIKSRDPIRCRECGHRIMYKKRTNRMMVFNAR